MTNTTTDAGGDASTDTSTDAGTDTGTGAATNPHPLGSPRNPRPAPEQGPSFDEPDDADTAAEIKKWKDLARKHEQQAKANAAAAKELEGVKASQMSEQEKAIKKAVDDATAATRAEVLKEVGGTLAEAAIKVAFAGRNVDVKALLKGIDPTKFLDDDGQPDIEEITKWADQIAPKAAEGDQPPTPRDLGNGPRGGQAPALNSSQLEKDLKAKLGV